MPTWKDIVSTDIQSLPFKSSQRTERIEEIFMSVGYLLTCWEAMLSDAAELFDIIATPAGCRSNRTAFAAFSTISSPSGQADVLKVAAHRSGIDEDSKERVLKIANWLDKLSTRRNEVAHGRAISLEEHGFMLGPNNISSKKWTAVGSAKYQLTAESILKSASTIVTLHHNILFVLNMVNARDRNG